MLKLNISVFVNIEGRENSIFIYLFVFYVTSSIILFYKINVKSYYFLLIFYMHASFIFIKLHT